MATGNRTKKEPEADQPEAATPIANSTFGTRKTGDDPIPAQSTPAGPNSTFASRAAARKGGRKAVQDGENKAVQGSENK